MWTDRSLSLAKMAFSLKRSRYVYLVMICLTLTLNVVAQKNDKISQDTELRKAKLRSLLVIPPSASSIPKRNGKQTQSTASENIVSSSTQSSMSTVNIDLENDTLTSSIPILNNERETKKLLEFLASVKRNETQSMNKTSKPNARKLQESTKGCKFESELGTLNCKDGLEFFDINLAYKQTLQMLSEQQNDDKSSIDLQLTRIDIFSCNLPILFSLNLPNNNHSHFVASEDESNLISSVENIKTIAMVNSGIESIENGAFDHFSQSLIQLDLSNNKLDRIPNAILRLRYLIDLNLSGNQITQLPSLPQENLVKTGGSFRNLVRLSSLNLGNNRYLEYFVFFLSIKYREIKINIMCCFI